MCRTVIPHQAEVMRSFIATGRNEPATVSAMLLKHSVRVQLGTKPALECNPTNLQRHS